MATYIRSVDGKVQVEIEPGSPATLLPNIGTQGIQKEIDDLEQAITTYRGQPVVVENAADMDDELTIYLYMGSESGYNANHWYYYDGTEWVDGGEYVANPVIIDGTLTQSGEAADAKVTGDEISALKADLGKYGYSVTPQSGVRFAIIPIADNVSSGVTIYAQALNTGESIDYARLVGTTSGELVILDLTDGTAKTITTAVNYTNVKIVYHTNNATDGNTEYSAVVVKTDDPVSLSHDVENIRIEMGQKLPAIDSPFETDVSAVCRGIIGVKTISAGATDSFQPETIERIRIKNVYYKTSGFYLFIATECLRDGVWSNYDNITILTADAPTETGLMIVTSNYKRFQLAFIPSLMTVGRTTNVAYVFKKTAVNAFITDLQKQINKYVPYDSYEIKDTTTNIVTVKPDGTGDYTTIGAAYAAIKDSSFFNQYEICVYPGTYHEVNLICPPYTHTHGMLPNTVTVTSEGETGTLPVFDQKSFPSKLSDMKIVSGTGYCIHIDNPLIHSVVNENLYCKKAYDSAVPDFAWLSKSASAIIGIGAQPAGMTIIFNSCVFEDGAVVQHSNSNDTENGNFHVIYQNCRLVNAQIRLIMAGNTGAATKGNWVCEIENLDNMNGLSHPGIGLRYGNAVSGLDYNFGWQLIGGIINTAIEFLKSNDATAPDCWANISLSEKSYIQAGAAIQAGQWITDAFIPATANEKGYNIIGVALANASSGDTCPIWKGKSFVVSASNGEYGIGSDGALSSSATEKIGKVISNIFYRY